MNRHLILRLLAAALLTMSLSLGVAGCADSGPDPVQAPGQGTEDEVDEVDENEPDENEGDENEGDENERDENEPDENEDEPGENEDEPGENE